MLIERLAPDALVSIQCTSPLVAPKSYWCILASMQSAGFHVRPFQATVPSFGIWGFALASPQPLGETPRLDPTSRLAIPDRRGHARHVRVAQ